MIRKIISIVAALACAAGLSVATAGTAAASVNPLFGAYEGVDHHGSPVSFSFNGSRVTHLSVDDFFIGTADVAANGQWVETCAGGTCVKGHWVTNTKVEGSWRQRGSGEWKSFSARTAEFNPYEAHYRGSDRNGVGIRFWATDGVVRDFTWNYDSSHTGHAYVDETGHFSACTPARCFRGHWQSDFLVVGEWRDVRDGQHDWHPWEAHAYSR